MTLLPVHRCFRGFSSSHADFQKYSKIYFDAEKYCRIQCLLPTDPTSLGMHETLRLGSLIIQ